MTLVHSQFKPHFPPTLVDLGTQFREEMEYCIHNMTLDIADLCSDGNCEEFVSEEPVDQCKNLQDA